MSKFKELIEHLKSCEDKCSDVLKIRSSKLDINLLNKFDISYEIEAEAITIDLSIQKFRFFKNKIDTLSQRESFNENNSIIIIEEGSIYYENNSSDPFFENIFFIEKLKHLFLETEVISYDDELSEIFILLSENMGKLEVGYSEKDLTFFNTDNDLKNLYNSLSKKLKEEEYDSFLRDNFIRIAKDIKEVDRNKSFFLTLMDLNIIYKNANREFELYKHKFSFENFLTELHEEKEKYIKSLQENLSDFLSKINSLPIQFGVYILLVFRFKDEIIPLIATIILIIAWSAFSINSLNVMKKSINYSKRKFEEIMTELSEKSGIDLEDLDKDKKEVSVKIQDIKCMLKRYRYMVVIFTLVFISFSSYNIYKEVNKVKNNHESKILEKRNEIISKKNDNQVNIKDNQVNIKDNQKIEKKVLNDKSKVTDINSDNEIKKNNVSVKETDKKDNISKFFE